MCVGCLCGGMYWGEAVGEVFEEVEVGLVVFGWVVGFHGIIV